MSDLAHPSRPERSRRSDVLGLIGVFLAMQFLAALIWTVVMGLRPAPSTRSGETSVRGVVMEALAEHLTPATAAVLVERPKPVKSTPPPVAKPDRRSSPAPARPAVTAWEPPAWSEPAAAYVPPPAPRAYAPAPRAYVPPPPAYVPPPAPRAAPGWSDVAPPQGEH